MGEFVSVDPLRGTLLQAWPDASSTEIEHGLARAERVARRLAERGVAERARALGRLAESLRDATEPLARIATREMGKPIAQARAEVEKCAAACAHYAATAQSGLATRRVDAGARESGWRYDALGPVLAIMPWNFPYWQVIRCLAPAIATGNPVLLKHAPNVQGCAEALVERVDAIDGLDGVLQNLRLPIAQVESVIDDPRVAAVTLTGSVAAGRAVAALAGRALKPVVLELGGSDPFLVFDDADVDEAVEVALWSRLINGGQSCIAAKRIIVTPGIADAFVEALRERWRAVRIGDPMDPATLVGPLARPDLAHAIARQVEASVAAGAVECARVAAPEGPCFADAVLLDHVAPGHPAFDEETFGPLGAIVRAANDEDALALANRTPYGLGATVFTADEDRALRLLPRLRAGHVAINGMVRSDPRLPFGGVGVSGVGRELGPHGLHAFANIRAWTIDGSDSAR